MTDLMLEERSFTFSPQRLFSPASPLTSRSAALSFSEHALASASTFYLTVSASSSYLLRAFTRSLRTRTRSLTRASSFCLVDTVSLALFCSSTRGLTSLNMRLNVTILVAQPHNYEAAKFCVFMNFSLKLRAGSSHTLLTGARAPGSISSPLKSLIRWRN